MASSIDGVAGASSEEAGSTSYQTEHMGMIFEDGFSFSGFERDKLFLGDGSGHFADVSDVSGLDDPNDGRAAVLFDVDDDGDQDIFVHNIARARHRLYRNETIESRDEARFIKVRLQGTDAARDAAGATVRVTFAGGQLAGDSQSQVLSFGAGFVSQSAPELVFGLGDAAGASVSVLWPGGDWEAFGDVEGNARVLLVEGAGEAESIASLHAAFADPTPPGLKVDVGADLSKFVVLDVDGAEVSFDGRADGETWLNIWATWCAGCRQELPALVELNAQPDKRVVMLSVDVPEDRAKAAGVLEASGLGEAGVYLSPAFIEDVIDVDRLALPTTLVLDRDGMLTRIVRGRIDR